MSKAQEITIKMSSERLVLTGLIASQAFCARIVPMVNLDAFQISWARKIAEWCLEYFNKYKIPIYTNIQVKYDEEVKNLDQDEADLIATFLENIAKDFEKTRNYFNDQLFIDRAIDFFRQYSIEVIRDKLTTCIETGKLDDAYQVLHSTKEVLAETTKISKLYDPDEDDTWFDEARNASLIEIPGAFGKMMGIMARGNLVSFLGPMKRGKTWMLLYLAYCAIRSGRRTLFISHEMNEREIKQRLYSMIMRKAWREPDDDDHVVYPRFDCLKNQSGTCGLRYRNGGGVFGTENYKPCSVCRTKNKKEFQVSVYARPFVPDIINPSEYRGKLRAFDFMYGKYFRMRCANFSSPWPAIQNTIEQLEVEEDYYADVVIEDYINIRSPHNFGLGRINKIDMIDMNWKETKAYASATGRLYITGHQGTRATISKSKLKADDTSGFIDIVAHVNKLFGLNQTTKEKEKGVMRINALANRMEHFSEDVFCTILQCPWVGRPVLDSHYGYIKSLKKNDHEEG